MSVDTPTRVKLAVYRHFAETGAAPTTDVVAARLRVEVGHVLDAYRRLGAQRLLVLEADGASIRMAPPFSGVRTAHVVEAGSVRYFANCAWDALGIPAALHAPGIVHSACGQTGEPCRLSVGIDGPEPSDWRFHCLVPAAKWWDDIVFT